MTDLSVRQPQSPNTHPAADHRGPPCRRRLLVTRWPRLVFQSEREPGNPFYQIYVMDLETGDVERVSPGIGKTTCAFINPETGDILFSSTHHDPTSRAAAGGARVPRLGAGAALRVGLRSGDGDLRAQRAHRHAAAPHERARLRRRGELLPRRPAGSSSRPRATPTTARSRPPSSASSSSIPATSVRSTSCRPIPTAPACGASRTTRLRRRPVLLPRR
jgi:hypothetical protein